MPGTITRSEVLAAQKAWGDGLLKISADNQSGGYSKAKATATEVILREYDYQYGPVAFKPTLTVAPQVFRPTFDGALSYFVGGNPQFPADTGFALSHYTSYKFENNVIQLYGDSAISMGNVYLYDPKGVPTIVDKTFGFNKSPDGSININLHHSSLPHPRGGPVQVRPGAEDLRQSSNISSYKTSLSDVLSAQNAWGEALLKISADYKSGGISKARTTAEGVIDGAYNYQHGPVAFKPTLTEVPETFRPTFDGALSYFVGGNDPEYPNDKGFALQSGALEQWTSFKFENKVIQLDGDSAISMGNVYVTDQKGNVTVVDKTFGWNKSSDGTMRINLHHSSLQEPSSNLSTSPTGAPVYRLLSSSGDHFFTNNAKEVDSVTGTGQIYEGIGFSTPNNGTQGLYRFYNASRRAHFYTASEVEKNALVAPSSGYAFEGNMGNVYSPGSAVPFSTPVYRLFNAGSGMHHFTIDQRERDSLLSPSSGWASEGIGFNV